MYRVELKVNQQTFQIVRFFAFLMYRVELKVNSIKSMMSSKDQFLMYRVELKVVLNVINEDVFVGS